MNAETLQRWANPRVILVATNLADAQILTFHATSQARESGAKILLVHVLRPPSIQSEFDPPPASLLTGSQEAVAWEVLDRMTRMIEWQGAPCEPLLAHGDPVAEIASLVQSREVDRVIVATRSARGLERLLAGSVAEGLMSSVDVPVCVIGPHVVAGALSAMPGGQMLVALSLQHDRADCLRFAGLLASRRHSALTLMHVVEDGRRTEQERATARDAAQTSIAALAASVPGIPPGAAIVIREGAVSKSILSSDICPEWDLIVMGASSRGVVTKLLGNSVVDRVIADAKCPVITIRPSAEQQRTLRLSEAEARFLDRTGGTEHSRHR